jgi:hypothetical protein
MKFTAEQEAAIAKIQQERKLTRKSAVQFYRRQKPGAQVDVAPPAPAVETAPATPAPTVAATEPAAAPKAAKKKKVKAAKESLPKGKPGRTPKVTQWDEDKVVQLYKDGAKVVDIAEKMGYKRGEGQNRVRITLMTKGVYKQRA